MPTDPYNAAPLRSIRDSTDKPIVIFGRMAQNATDVSRKFEREIGMPFIQGLPETVRALQGLVRYAAAQRRGVASLPEPRGSADNLAGARLDALLAEHGMIAPRSALAKNAVEAAERAAAIGFPVAVKIVSPQASHKTEVGGVALGLRDAAAVQSAADAHGQAARGTRSRTRRSKASSSRRWWTASK